MILCQLLVLRCGSNDKIYVSHQNGIVTYASYLWNLWFKLCQGTVSKWVKKRGEVEKKFKWVPKFKRGPKDIFPRGDLTLEWYQEFIRGAENL